jgi:hypothetical protein
MVDPIFQHELALELGMSLGEMGQRMSAHEMCVLWPAYFAHRARIREQEEEKQSWRDSLK